MSNKKICQKQCKNCPFRKDSDISKIPNYNRDSHVKLVELVEKPSNGKEVFMMLCHHDAPEKAERRLCTGYIYHKLVERQNDMFTALRILHTMDADTVQVVGEQHQSLRDSLR